MNYSKTLLTLAFAALSAMAVSCGKDKSPAEAVAGTYSGTVAAEVSGSQQGTVSISRTADREVTVVLPSYEYQGHNALDATTFEGVSVGEAGDDYTLYKAQGTDTLRGTLSGKRLALDYTITPGTMPMPIHFTFEGE